jgi:hypothetical protein
VILNAEQNSNQCSSSSSLKLDQWTQGELMVVLPLSRSPRNQNVDPKNPRALKPASSDRSISWLRVSSAAALVTGGALLLAGKHRLGLIAAATGTSLAMLDQQDSVKKWWAYLPGYIANVQGMLTQVEGAVEEFAHQRDRFGKVIGR